MVYFQSSFFFGIVWSIGATCDADSRIKFDAMFKDLMSGKMEECPIPAFIGKIDCPMPADHSVYEYMFEVPSFWLKYSIFMIAFDFFFFSWDSPTDNYLFKVHNGSTRKLCEIWLKLTIKKTERHHVVDVMSSWCLYC